MAILDILQYPDARLRRKAPSVEDIKTSAIQKMIDDMLETQHNTEHCAGLSATQLDIKDPKRITVIDESPDNKQPFCLINPVIVHTEGESQYPEGCMSIYADYNIYGTIKRADKITFTALDRDGNQLEICAEGFFSRCVQHEIDHLDGILFLDRLSSLKRKLLDKKIVKIRKKLY